jgi:hypothetical protein
MSSYYNNKIKTDLEFYEKEKKRVALYHVKRYEVDEEFREKKKTYSRIKMNELYHRRKAEKALNVQINKVI